MEIKKDMFISPNLRWNTLCSFPTFSISNDLAMRAIIREEIKRELAGYQKELDNELKQIKQDQSIILAKILILEKNNIESEWTIFSSVSK